MVKHCFLMARAGAAFVVPDFLPGSTLFQLFVKALPSHKSLFAFLLPGKRLNQQPDQQNAMSCATSVFLGSSRRLASRCKVYPVQIHTVEVIGSNPIAPTNVFWGLERIRKTGQPTFSLH